MRSKAMSRSNRGALRLCGTMLSLAVLASGLVPRDLHASVTGNAILLSRSADTIARLVRKGYVAVRRVRRLRALRLGR